MPRDDEGYWALVAQAIPDFNNKAQQSFLASLGSFRAIFDSSEEIPDQVANKLLKCVRVNIIADVGRILTKALQRL